MRLKLVKFVFIFVLSIYFLVLISSTVPATWVAWGIHRAAPNVWLSGVSGSLWEGEAEATQIKVGPEAIALGHLKWTINPWAFLRLSVCLDVSAEAQEQSLMANICHGVSGITKLKDVSLDLPVERIQKLIPVETTGEIIVDVASAVLEKQHITELDGIFEWRDANVFVEGTWYTIGTTSATLAPSQDGGIDAHIVDIESPYTLDLKANWEMGQDWRIAGTVEPQASAPEIVTQVLQGVAEELDDGVYKVQWPL